MEYRYEMGDIVDIANTEQETGGLKIRHIIAFERSDLFELALGAVVVTLVSTVIGALASRIINPK